MYRVYIAREPRAIEAESLNHLIGLLANLAAIEVEWTAERLVGGLWVELSAEQVVELYKEATEHA